MADSNNPRSQRAYDPQQYPDGAEGAQVHGGGDPLVELARLIGQSDPFADFERNRAGSEAGDAPVYTHPPGWALDDATMPAHPHPYPAEGYAQYPDPAYGDPADPYQAHQPYYDPYYDPEGPGLDEAEYHERQEGQERQQRQQRQEQRRRTRLVVVIAILALAVLGTAGAYGYRTFFGSEVHASLPPVIKADPTPTKVIPAAQASDSGSNKLIYDRVGESGQVEKVVPREEKPIDIKTATVGQPRIVHPAAMDANAVPAPPPAAIPMTRQSTGGQVLPVASSPYIATPGSGAILPSAKKVRTLIIRPDMTVVPTPGASTPEPEPPAKSVADAPQTTRIAAPPPLPRTRSAAPAPSPAPEAVAPVPTPAPSRRLASAPLSLSPGSLSQPAPSEAAATADGRFTVQVASQRSEAEANASYRALQARYPDVLGAHSALVRRADLGSRGIYYRALVGPFATAEQAGQLCSSLKAAGGQCIIHRN